MNRPLTRTSLLMIASILALSACKGSGPLIGAKPGASSAASAPGPSSRPPPGTPGNPNAPGGARGTDEQALRDGIELYNKGQYNDAIKRLSGPEISGGAKANQVQAHKYTAFSYCLTARQTLCRHAFEKAFKLDGAFDLQPGEHGHPLWGRAFARAKKQSGKS